MKTFSFTTGKGFDHPGAMWDWLEALPMASKVRVTLEVLTQKHSDSQRKRYFARHVYGVMELLNVDRELPLSKDQVHEALKRGLLGTVDTPLGPVTRSTKGLDIAEFSDYCHKIDEWVLQRWGVVLPEYGDDY